MSFILSKRSLNVEPVVELTFHNAFVDKFSYGKREGFDHRTGLRGGGKGVDGINNGINDLSPTMHRDAITQDIANGLINDISDASEIAPYAMDKNSVDMLLSVGIPASRSFTKSHRHPMHKSIENWILFRVVPNMITMPCTAMWIKPSKYDRLNRLQPKFKDLLNSIVTPRDHSRYNNTFPTGVFTTSVFIHDALHYMSMEEFTMLFVENPDLQEVVATVVYPVEVLTKEKSFFPTLYELEYVDDGFVYSMEGDSTDHYVQPFNDWVITTKTITFGSLILSLERIEGFYGHHVYVIRRGKYKLPGSYLAPLPNCICLPTTNLLKKKIRSRLVPREVYEKAVHHARNLKSLRTQDAIAKVRSYQHDVVYNWVDPGAWEYLTRYVIAAANVLGEQPDIAAEIDNPVWLLTLKRWWANRPHKIGWIISGTWFVVNMLGDTGIWIKLGCTSLTVSLPLAFTFFSTLIMIRLTRRHWLTPTRREEKRLAMLYPNKYNNVVKLIDRDMIATISYPLAKGLLKSTGDEFPVYTPVPEAKPDSLISDGTDVEDPGPSISQVGQVNKMVEPVRSVANLDLNDDDCGGLRLDSSVVDVQTVVPMEEGFNINAVKVILPKINLHKVKSVDFIDEPVVIDEDRLIVPGTKKIVNGTDDSASNGGTSCLSNVKDSYSLAEVSVVRCYDLDGVELKQRKKTRGRRKGRKIVSETPKINQELVNVDPVEAEGERGEGWLHEFLEVKDINAVGRYHMCDLRDDKFDGDFATVPLCLIDSLSGATGYDRTLLNAELTRLPRSCVVNDNTIKEGLSDWHAAFLAYSFGWILTIWSGWGKYEVGVKDGLEVNIWHVQQGGMGHFTHVRPYRVLETKEDRPFPGGLHGASLGTKLFSRALLSWRSEDGSAVPFKNFSGYVVDPQRAKPLARDMASGKTGVVFGPNEKHSMGVDAQVRWRRLVDGQECRPEKHRRRVHVAAIYGYPGCGKSWPVSQVLRGLIGSLDFRVSVPTVKLREEWQQMLKLPEVERWRVNTYESTMRKHTEVLIIDEISLMPAGYVDFLISISPRLRCVLILGDVTQLDRHEVHPESTCAKLLPEAKYWKSFSPFYLGYTRRLSKKNAELFSVTTYSDRLGWVGRRETRGPEPIITAIAGDAKVLAELGTGATTFPSSQGSTYDPVVQILMDRAALEKCSIGAVHTAVTRSRTGVILVGRITGNWHNLAMSNPFWRAILTQEPVDWKIVFANELRGFEILGGPYRPDKLTGGELVEHGFPLDMLPPMRRVGHTGLKESLPIDEPCEEFVCEEIVPRITWGQMDSKQLFNQIYQLKPCDGVDRLKFFEGEPSQQFEDREAEGANEDGDYPEQIAARHKRGDPTLLPLSVPKRLRFRTLAANKFEVLSKFFVGQELFQSYCRLMRLDPLRPFAFDDILYHDCIDYNEWHSLTNKTQKAILANENKSDPDWVWTFIRVFMKQQRKVNDSTLNGDWKAGQTISNMNDQWLLFLGPTIRYMSRLEKNYCPKRIYLHGGRSNIDLDDFCLKNIGEGEKYSNDYTSFDQSQTGEVLASELLYMWHAGIPENVISIYENNKVDMFCAFGHLQTMRFSGEPATYAFNCRCNLAVLNLQFPLDVYSEVAVMVSGDDGGIDAVLPERASWGSFSQHLTLKAKPYVGKRLLFVGYICTSKGAIRDPVPMLARFHLASDAGKLHQIVQSYATELSTGYLMAEHVFAVLTDFELDCFFCLVRAFHLKHASSKLKFRKSSLLGFVNLSEKALGRIAAGSKLDSALRRDLVSYYWRLTDFERSGVEKQLKSLVNVNLLEYGRRD